MRRGRPARRWAAVAVAAAVSLAGCSSDPNSLAEQARSGDGKGYVAGDGSWEALEPQQRAEPVELRGTTVDGKTWDRAVDAADTVTVVNVWGSWCAPCVEETPVLQEVWSQLQQDRAAVSFIGLNVRESPETGQGFLLTHGVTYPSLSNDASDGEPLLALQGKAPTTPTTLVLDTSGRIAARILGPVDAAVLRGLIDDTLAAP